MSINTEFCTGWVGEAAGRDGAGIMYALLVSTDDRNLFQISLNHLFFNSLDKFVDQKDLGYLLLVSENRRYRSHRFLVTIPMIKKRPHQCPTI